MKVQEKIYRHFKLQTNGSAWCDKSTYQSHNDLQKTRPDSYTSNCWCHLHTIHRFYTHDWRSNWCLNIYEIKAYHNHLCHYHHYCYDYYHYYYYYYYYDKLTIVTEKWRKFIVVFISLHVCETDWIGFISSKNNNLSQLLHRSLTFFHSLILKIIPNFQRTPRKWEFIFHC